MATIHDLDTVRRYAIPAHLAVALSEHTVPAETKTVLKALGLIVLAVFAVGAAAVAMAAFLVVP